MTQEMLDYLSEIIPQILTEYPHLFTSETTPDNWYESRHFFLNKNQFFLEKVKEKMECKFDTIVSVEELFYMQKMFLIYPSYIPKKLLKLPWEHIKILLDLCSEEKRKFYIDLCYDKKLSVEILKEYILNDIYEKSLVLIEEINDYNKVVSKDFLNQVLEIYPMVWN